MTLRILEHDSRTLAGNPLGDPARRELWVYLPPGYPDGGAYPVLWCLAGFTGTGAMAVTGNRWAPGLAERMDRLIARGCPPAIVAFPDCFTRWGGSQYADSSAHGDYETYLCEELIPLVEAEFRTTGSRGVFGKSSGGYGALRLSMRRPNLFSACACHSGDMAFELCYAPDFAKCIAAVADAGGLAAWVERFERAEKKRSSDFPAINTLAMAAAYSPDPVRELGVAFPFDFETGERIPEVWARWKESDPVEMVRRPECADALRSLALLYLDCGSKDEFQLHLGLRLFRRRLEEAGIAHEAEEFDDDHRSVSYRYEVSIPRLVRAVSGA